MTSPKVIVSELGYVTPNDSCRPYPQGLSNEEVAAASAGAAVLFVRDYSPETKESLRKKDDSCSAFFKGGWLVCEMDDKIPMFKEPTDEQWAMLNTHFNLSA